MLAPGTDAQTCGPKPTPRGPKRPPLPPRSKRRAAGRAAQLPLRLHEGNLISLPERRRATRCLWCCNIIESAPLGRATRRQRGRGGRGGASRRSGKGRAGGAEALWTAIPDKASRSPAPAWAPPPHPKFCFNREPRSHPRALSSRTSAAADPAAPSARAQPRVRLWVGRAPRVSSPHTPGTRPRPLAPLPNPQT